MHDDRRDKEPYLNVHEYTRNGRSIRFHPLALLDDLKGLFTVICNTDCAAHPAQVLLQQLLIDEVILDNEDVQVPQGSRCWVDAWARRQHGRVNGGRSSDSFG